MFQFILIGITAALSECNLPEESIDYIKLLTRLELSGLGNIWR